MLHTKPSEFEWFFDKWSDPIIDPIIPVEQILRINHSTSQIKITHLGRGLSTGSELEYTDADTIKNALRSRI